MLSIFNEIAELFPGKFRLEQIGCERNHSGRKGMSRNSQLKIDKCTLIVGQKERLDKTWSVSLKLLDPEGVEVWNHDYSPAQGNHYHTVENGKKTEKHVKTDYGIKAALEQMASIVKCYP